MFSRTGVVDGNLSQVRGRMPVMREWSPWEHLDRSAVRLAWARLPYVTGAYVPGVATVILHPESTSTQQRSALAEELAHHELAHEPVADPVALARQELRARRWAAVRLVSAEQILEAVMWTPYLHEVAELLDVDPDLVEIRVELMTLEERRLLEERLADGSDL